MKHGRRRAPISAAVKHQLNDQCSSACAVCRETKTSTLEIHHIDGDTQNPSLENLLLVCGSCHNEFTRGTKSEADARLYKRMAEAGKLPPRKDAPRSAGVVNHGENHGIIAGVVNVGKIVRAPKEGPIIMPGTIGANPVHANYIEYLVKQLSDFRRGGSSYGQRRTSTIHPGVIRAQIRNEMGALPKDLPDGHYETLRDYLRAKIDATIRGKTNRAKGIRNYHTEAEHLIPKSKRKR